MREQTYFKIRLNLETKECEFDNYNVVLIADGKSILFDVNGEMLPVKRNKDSNIVQTFTSVNEPKYMLMIDVKVGEMYFLEVKEVLYIDEKILTELVDTMSTKDADIIVKEYLKKKMKFDDVTKSKMEIKDIIVAYVRSFNI